MEFCSHSHGITTPTNNTRIFKDECTLCFDNQVNICTNCFNGSCSNHSNLHFNKRKHPVYISIRKIRVKESKILKLEIKQEEFSLEIQVECKICSKASSLEDLKDDKLLKVVDFIKNSVSAKDQSQIKAWEQEIVSCTHILNLVQESKSLDKNCRNCDLKENLWACLTCGNLGCGRAQFGGVGGNGHGLLHYESSHHPVAVKLGTITADGNADVFCYACGEERIDQDLPKHLRNFGIEIDSVQKTEKSLGEMVILGFLIISN